MIINQSMCAQLQAKRRAEGETVKARCLASAVQKKSWGNQTCANVICFILGVSNMVSISPYTSMDQQGDSPVGFGESPVTDSRSQELRIQRCGSLFYKKNRSAALTESLNFRELLNPCSQ